MSKKITREEYDLAVFAVENGIGTIKELKAHNILICEWEKQEGVIYN